VRAAIDVHLDLRHAYGAVRFRDVLDGEKVGSEFAQDPNGDDLDVVIEHADAGDVVGVEVMGFDDVTLDAAVTIARGFGLAFPIETFRAAARERTVGE
jgi:hypothetical protein